MADGLRVDFNLTGLDGVLSALELLPAEVVSKRGGPVRASLRKGAVLLRNEEIKHLRAAVGTTHFLLAGTHSTGLLEKSLVVTRGKGIAGANGERYLVRVKRANYPGRKTPASTVQVAQLLEYGRSGQPAEPWIRPAFLANARRAADLVTNDMKKQIDRIVKKLLLAQAKGKT